ncbi:MAG: hypothetical protein JEZ12_27760 [Desulfobacterium sp.]|nr:hypothetical protein [Desulfobacterium sp.]
MSRMISRYETNRKIKSCLVSHKADIAGLVFSFSGKTAWFHGKLTKIQGGEFSVEEIELLCKAISALPEIRFLNFELEDWSISASLGSFSIARKTVAAPASVGYQDPLVIKTDEDIEDVLADNHVG